MPPPVLTARQKLKTVDKANETGNVLQTAAKQEVFSVLFVNGRKLTLKPKDYSKIVCSFRTSTLRR